MTIYEWIGLAGALIFFTAISVLFWKISSH